MAWDQCPGYLYSQGVTLSLSRATRPCLRWILAGIWLWFACLDLGAQALAFRRFDHRDGLPESQVYALLEDRDGFLWSGSDNTLSRLGGSGFQAFSVAQGLGCRSIRSILQDRRGSIWVAGAGVSEVRGSVITNYGPDQGLTVDDRIYALAEGDQDDLFVGTRLGLFRKRPGAGFTQVKLPGNWFYSPIFCVAPDGRGGVWVGSRKGALGHWDGRRLTQVELPKAAQALSVLQLKQLADGTLRVLCSRSLLRLAPDGTWQPEPLPGLKGQPKLGLIREDAQGGLVIPLGLEGIYVRSPSGQGRQLTYRDGLPRQEVMAALRDRTGVLWAGTDGGGLVALPTPGMMALAYNPETGLDLGLGNVLHFLELTEGRMLMATFGGLVLWQEKQGVLQRWDTRNGMPSNEVWTLEPDGEGGAWLGTTLGLAHWNGGRILPGPEGLKDAAVNQFLRHQGRLWAGTSKGLAELDLKGRLLSLSVPPQEVGGTNVSQMLARPWGLLVGTQLGPYTFRDGHFKKAYPDAPVAKQEVATLDEDASGQLWLGTLHGLFGLVGPPSNRQWKAMGGALQNGISWVRLLPSGGLAVGHTKGVTLLSASGEHVDLTRNLGLLSDETNQDSACLDRRGRLWVGMLGGVSLLEDPGSICRQGPPPGPRILEASWGAQSAWLPEALQLPPNPANLSVTFDVALPCAAQAPRYQVKIDGLNAEWRSLEGAGRSVQIAQLGPGTYTFRVRASQDGVTWAESSPCPMVVRRAWHQTWLARAGLLLAGCLGLALLGNLRFRSLKRRATLLEAKVQERTQELALRNQSLARLHHQLKENMEGRIHFINAVTHDLRSPLTSILLGVDRLKALGGAGTATVLGLMERESKRLEQLLKGILDKNRAHSLEDSLNVRLCHPSEILHGLAETFQLKAQARDLAPSLDLDPRSDSVWVLADATALQQVLFNLVENALKFTAAPGAVGIRSKVLAEAWRLEVWDEGRGIDPSKLEEIFLPYAQTQVSDGRTGWGLGLSICKAVAEAHSGQIEVASELGRGTRFRVTIPLVLPTKEG